MIKASPIHGTNEESNQRWFFDFYEQWSGLFPPRNWVDFTLIDIGGEYSPYKRSCEFSAALLGFRLTVTYVYNTAFQRKLEKMMDEILK